VSTNSIKNDELEFLKINKVLVNPSLGVGIQARGLEGIKRDGSRCFACGTDKHDVPHCYSATADGSLSLPSLADMKLEGAQRQNCCLVGQPSQVTEVLRDLVTRIRRNLTQADRDKNNQNRRDTKNFAKVCLTKRTKILNHLFPLIFWK
jgi:hypothetical protein